MTVGSDTVDGAMAETLGGGCFVSKLEAGEVPVTSQDKLFSICGRSISEEQIPEIIALVEEAIADGADINSAQPGKVISGKVVRDGSTVLDYFLDRQAVHNAAWRETPREDKEDRAMSQQREYVCSLVVEALKKCGAKTSEELGRTEHVSAAEVTGGANLSA